MGMKYTQPLDRLVASPTMLKKLRTDMLLTVNMLYILHVADELVIFDHDGVILQSDSKTFSLSVGRSKEEDISDA